MIGTQDSLCMCMQCGDADLEEEKIKLNSTFIAL